MASRTWAFRLLVTGTFTAASCNVDVHLGKPDDVLETLGGMGGSVFGATCALADSRPLLLDTPGEIAENLRIKAVGVPGITITAPDVVVRNVFIEHAGAPGILIQGAPRTRLSNMDIVHVGAPQKGPAESIETNNITAADSDELWLENIRVTRGSSGIYLQACPNAQISNLEGHDMLGPFPRGQLVRFEASDDCRLEEFSIENTKDSWTENNVHVSRSSNVRIRRGLVIGNNSPQGHGVLFSDEEATGLVEDVDALLMGNGCFSAYTGGDGTIFRRTRCRDNICDDQGRGVPSSGGIMWSGDETQSNLKIEDSVYFASCNTSVVWPEGAFSTLDLRSEDFTPRAPVRATLCWE